MSSPLADVVAAVERLPREIIDRATKRFAEIALDEASRVVGGGGVMNMHTSRGRRPVQLRTRTQVLKRSAAVAAVVRGSPVGPWVWIEDGTERHEIKPRRRRGRRAVMGGGLDHPVSGVVRHPGTRGRHAWTRAADEIEYEIDGLVNAEVREVVRG